MLPRFYCKGLTADDSCGHCQDTLGLWEHAIGATIGAAIAASTGVADNHVACRVRMQGEREMPSNLICRQSCKGVHDSLLVEAARGPDAATQMFCQ